MVMVITGFETVSLSNISDSRLFNPIIIIFEYQETRNKRQHFKKENDSFKVTLPPPFKNRIFLKCQV